MVQDVASDLVSDVQVGEFSKYTNIRKLDLVDHSTCNSRFNMGIGIVQDGENAFPEQLVPIRLGLTFNDGAHVRDTFCLSLATQTSTLEHLANQLCFDACIEATPDRTQALVQAMQGQLDHARQSDTATQRVQAIKYGFFWCVLGTVCTCTSCTHLQPAQVAGGCA